MKTLRLIALIVMAVALLAVQVSAEAKYLGVSWFDQPDPANPNFIENADGSFSSNGAATASIAWVVGDPPGPAKVMDLEIQMVIPDIEGDWAGFYVHNEMAANAFGGNLFFFNNTGANILSWGTVILAENVGAEYFNLGAMNDIKVTFADGGVKVWVNGNLIIDEAGVPAASGFTGLTALNNTAKFQNIKITTDTEAVYESLTVEEVEPTTAPTEGENPTTGDMGLVLALVGLAAGTGTLLVSRRR